MHCSRHFGKVTRRMMHPSTQRIFGDPTSRWFDQPGARVYGQLPLHCIAYRLGGAAKNRCAGRFF
jgi:hypothetical protein